MKPKSIHEKGNRFENYLVDIIRESIDKTAHRTNASGAGLDKNDIRLPALDIEIEAKNASQINLIKDWEQLQRQITQGNVGILAIRNPKKPEFQEVLIVLELGDWFDLLQGNVGEVEVINNKDRELEFAIRSLKESCNKILKKLNK